MLVKRRELLKSALLGAGGMLLSRSASASAAVPPAAGPCARIAHITDVHIQNERGATEWFARCLRHLQEQPQKVQMILNGGDSIMDSLAAGADHTRRLWELWTGSIRKECSLPIEHCIGNHDIWGWDRKHSGTTGDEPLYGKKWALESLGLEKGYRSFDRFGWHFIILDSVMPATQKDRTYQARLDEEQFQWLKSDLAAVPATTPVLVLSHIPIVSACAYFDGQNEESGDWRIPSSWVHIDARRIVELFAKHPNVKVCLSGHIHLQDRVEYQGVTYLCNGSVCGNWWKGDYQGCPPGYALLDLWADGAFRCSYVTYGWKQV